MAKIMLTQGFFAIVDKEDFKRVNIHRWKILKTDGKLYACRTIKRRHTLLMHRFLTNAKKGQFVDHRNGNGLDNRRLNIRLCTQSQNLANSKKTRGVSKFKGVYWNKEKQKWQVQISYKHTNRYVGRFTSEYEAAKAYDTKAFELFGEFALLNFPRKVNP